MKDYALAFLAGIWLADGVSLLLAPRVVMERLREITLKVPGIFRWQILSLVAGVALLFLGLDLIYQPIWIIVASGMIGKGLLLWLGPAKLRERVLAWCVAREDVDYRFWGLGLCALAMLLLHALGWMGQARSE
jgi:hypothetical protein